MRCCTILCHTVLYRNQKEGTLNTQVLGVFRHSPVGFDGEVAIARGVVERVPSLTAKGSLGCRGVQGLRF